MQSFGKKSHARGGAIATHERELGYKPNSHIFLVPDVFLNLNLY